MRRALLFLCALMLGGAVPVHAALTPEQQEQAETHVKQFSAREFAVRQKAVDELIKMGPGVLPLVRKKLAATDDNEVKLRCEMVIKGIAGQPAAAVPDWRKRFYKIYRLSDDEVLKRIAPPFIPEREQYYDQEYPRGRLSYPEVPSFFLLQWHGKVRHYYLAYDQKRLPLRELLFMMFGVGGPNLESPDEVLNLDVFGDWIFRPDASQEVRLKALSAILAEDLGVRVYFEKRDVVRDVYVVTGDFKFHPVEGARPEDGLHVFAERLDPHIQGEADPKHVWRAVSLIKSLVRRGGFNVVDEAGIGNVGDFRVYFHEDSRAAGGGVIPEERLVKILANLERQTGLHIRKGRRAVPVWFVTDKVPPAKPAKKAPPLTPEQQRRAEALIKQFSARQFAVRQKAVDKLIKMGTDVLPLVRKALAETKDNEVKLRCDMVITGLAPKRPPASAKQILTEAVIKDLGPPAPLAGMDLRRTVNGESRAYIVKRGAKMLIVHNGKQGQEYDVVRDLSLSPNGSRVAYAAYQAGQAVRFFMVCDGLEGPKYAQVQYPVFSPDSKRLAYVARRGKRSFLVCDGKAWPEYDYVYPPIFSPNSRHVAHLAISRKKCLMVVNGVEAPQHDSLWFSGADDEGVRYAVADAGHLWLVELGWPGEGQRKPEALVEKRVKSFGKLPPEFPRVTHYWFSANGEGAVFTVTRAGKTVVIFNGKELGAYDQIQWTSISPNGRRFAYAAKREGKLAFYVNGKEASGRYDRIADVHFSPDSKRLAFTGWRGEHRYLVSDGKELTSHESFGRGITFSPDSKHLAYVARRGGSMFIVCDGKRGDGYDWVAPFPDFSPDSRHLWYQARRGADWFTVCDGLEMPPHARAWRDWRITGASTNSKAFRYLVVDGNSERLIEVAWPKDLDWTNGLKAVEP